MALQTFRLRSTNAASCYLDARKAILFRIIVKRAHLMTDIDKTRTSTMNSFRDPAIRITLLPRDTNSAGTIFGGVILSYIDMAGAIEAHRRTGMDRFVTVAMREVIFHKPVFVGDLVSFYAETVNIGNTSITIRVIVETERVGSKTEILRVTEAEVIYVAVDENRVKTKIVNRDS
jgi:acyl-CoA thioesterase YciA